MRIFYYLEWRDSNFLKGTSYYKNGKIDGEFLNGVRQ